MFGADTALVFDALQIGALALALGAGGFALFTKLRAKRGQPGTGPQAPSPSKADLEERVRVLERIATDRSKDLELEIEKLRSAPSKQENA